MGYPHCVKTMSMSIDTISLNPVCHSLWRELNPCIKPEPKASIIPWYSTILAWGQHSGCLHFKVASNYVKMKLGGTPQKGWSAQGGPNWSAIALGCLLHGQVCACVSEVGLKATLPRAALTSLPLTASFRACSKLHDKLVYLNIKLSVFLLPFSVFSLMVEWTHTTHIEPRKLYHFTLSQVLL